MTHPIQPGAARILTALACCLLIICAAVACAGPEPESSPPPATPSITPTPMPAAPTAAAAPATPIPPTPTPAPASPASPAAPSEPMTASDFPQPPDRDLPQLAAQLRWGGILPTPTAPHPLTSRPLSVGEQTQFWVLDYPRLQVARRDFRLAGISANAYWWVEDGVNVPADKLQQAMSDAEEQIYPRVSAVFGIIPELGAHGWRGHIISARLRGLGGYVAGADAYPATVNPYSNGVHAIYINAAVAPLGSAAFQSILAHELQHAIHWHADKSEYTWLNEGLAELAVSAAGHTWRGMLAYLRDTSRASLVNWPVDFSDDTALSYGAAGLFAHYLKERYAPVDTIRKLLEQPADSAAGVDAFLHQIGAADAAGRPANFHSVFADWIAANAPGPDGSARGYTDLDAPGAAITRRQKTGAEAQPAELGQYAVDYIEIDMDTDDTNDTIIHFAGNAETPLLPTAVPGGACWWTNRGDSIASTLTAPVSVPPPSPDTDAAEPTLSYRYWHSIESEWDYLYVAASRDHGATWQILPASGTTESNPVGNGYGPGYTGESDGWQTAAVPLTAYAGAPILLRFHYITDDAIHGPGACLREIQTPAGNSNDNDNDNAAGVVWQPDGFVPVNNRVQQDWVVWLIGTGSASAPASAIRMPLQLDETRRQYIGSAPIPPSMASEGRIIVAVSPTAPATAQPGEYRIWATASR